ncbi:PAQR family membrane homeostasis protein TrhA [Rhodophyticola sp.]|jgi:hemolysin III|uniref:PAQR family membrane homeostasis protein TrhA n=1 Tax=Rhodophyticola sp. TaxID=2680032 RepID=UPI003D28C8DC
MLPRRQPDAYSRAEYVSDAVVHVSGLSAAMIGGPVMITLAAVWIGDATIITATAIYTVCLIAMLLCSALYNMILTPSWQDQLRRIDQSAIYLKIAGTYTPVLVLTGAHAGWFLAGIWGVALAGASIILFSARRHRYLALALYLGLGWAGVAFGGPILAGLSQAGLILLLIGGLTYTAGVIFHVWENLPFHNTIWHVFVLVASGVIYAAVLVELAHAAGS